MNRKNNIIYAIYQTAVIIAILFIINHNTYAQEDYLNLIITDIYETLIDNEETVDFEQLTEDLLFLNQNPIDINNTTSDELKQLYFLTDEQIDGILLLAYQHPLNTIYELQLANGLKDYDYRNLLPFVTISKKEKEDKIYLNDLVKYPKREIDIRTDARNLENFDGDPIYASLKYRYNYKKKIEWGLTLERDPNEPLYYKNKIYGPDYYGGYLQISNMRHLKKFIIGDFNANFGLGLALNTNFQMGGKTAYLKNISPYKEGINRKSSTSEYNFLRGAGLTYNYKYFDATILYSARKVDGKAQNNTFPTIIQTGYHRTESEIENKRTTWQHIIGANLTFHYNKLKIGITATEHILSDTLKPTPTYYNSNYFSGKKQFSASLNYQWQFWRFRLFGELATSQNSTWGIGNITGLRFTTNADIAIVALYRYYSTHYDNLLGNGISESSKNNDENGLFIGADMKLPHHWQMQLYADLFKFSMPKYNIKQPSEGYEIMVAADYIPKTNLDMHFKLKAKQKGDLGKYSFRYIISSTYGNLTTNSYLETNLAKRSTEKISYGFSLSESVSYHLIKVPITLQLRLQAFYAPKWDNRIYNYENDVLYAFSIPATYGIGGRYYLNFRYKINKTISLYLKASQTVYTKQFAKDNNLSTNRQTDIHALIRLTL